MNATSHLDRWGTAGLFLTAILSPCCFPLFAVAASAFGLGTFELFGGWTMWIFQTMVLVSIAGLVLSYRKHWCIYPLLVAIPSGLLIFYGYHFAMDPTYFFYAGMLGLLGATGWNYYRNKLHGSCETCGTYNGKTVDLATRLTCPNCGHRKHELMPTDACVYFYECEKCKTVLKPKQGDCCVYCSYGTVKCPPIQSGEKCC
ncbi:MAG: MerC domain-containing protein [Flavobacteriales bacterium]|nr:MerC domain-containing protein [Flavobacteriales bacterium]MBK7941711.1 MerC domain-containing protein [Flavobacteriales bacterium]MBK8949263.1 MerC domain-containing protein [Flavobacteriales bacterium]MBK9700253.1 MerC domain-containing protein [Flavobacteriales bacterium]